MSHRRRPRREPHRFASEAELCDLFAAAARREGYAVHPETSDWDLLLVGPAGLQVGVQAKLSPGVDVLDQALTSCRGPGPAVHAALVPRASDAFLRVAAGLRVAVACFDCVDDPVYAALLLRGLERAPRWEHRGPAWVPDVAVETPAGVPCPRSVTPWKLAAVRLCLLLRERGYLTSRDFAAAKVSITWWTQLRAKRGCAPVRMLVSSGGRPARYVPSPQVEAGLARLPDELYPEVTAAVLQADR